jgi:hypothetical protein
VSAPEIRASKAGPDLESMIGATAASMESRTRLTNRPLLLIEQVSDPVEVAVHEGRDVPSFFRASPISQRGVHLLLLCCLNLRTQPRARL